MPPPEDPAYLMCAPQWRLTQATKVGEGCQELVEGLFAHRVIDNLRALQGLLQFEGRYGKQRLEADCARPWTTGPERTAT
jgi:hypothetical protein